ncbi:MAG: hypothetical protein ACOCX2_10270 [Armatimonadota bacterium]
MSVLARSAASVAALVLIVASACAEEPAGARFDFEDDSLADAWSTTACNATLAVTRKRANVREGRGALELNWEATDGRIAVLTVDELEPRDRPRSLRLSVKVGEPGPVMYGVQETGGAVYQGYLYSPGGVWHDVAVDLDELMLSETTEDDNGRLDAREISGIMIADLSNISGEAGQSLGIKSGSQQMWVDAVELGSDLAPHRSLRGDGGETIIDDFERTPIYALPIGGPDMTLTEGPGEGDASALRVEYRADGYRWVGFVGAIGYLDLTERSMICLSLRAEQAAPLQVVLEERDGSKYLARHRLDPEKGWYTLKLPFTKFKPDPQTGDENERLDLDQLRVVIPVVDSRRAEVEGAGAWELSRIWAE